MKTPGFLPEMKFSACDRAHDIIFDQLDAIPVSEADHEFLEAHLKTCAHCRIYQKTMRYMAGSLAEMDGMPVPAGLENRIMSAVSQIPMDVDGVSAVAVAPQSEPEKAPIPTLTPRGFNTKRYASLAAAVLVLAVAIPLVIQGISPQPVTSVKQEATVAQSAAKAIPPKETEPANNTGSAANAPSAMNGAASLAAASNQLKKKAAIPAETPAIASASPSPQPVVSTAAAARKASIDAPAAQSFAAGKATVESTATASIDKMEIASAIPAANDMLQETYGDSAEEGMYYDPVSSLVGF